MLKSKLLTAQLNLSKAKIASTIFFNLYGLDLSTASNACHCHGRNHYEVHAFPHTSKMVLKHNAMACLFAYAIAIIAPVIESWLFSIVYVCYL